MSYIHIIPKTTDQINPRSHRLMMNCTRCGSLVAYNAFNVYMAKWGTITKPTVICTTCDCRLVVSLRIKPLGSTKGFTTKEVALINALPISEQLSETGEFNKSPVEDEEIVRQALMKMLTLQGIKETSSQPPKDEIKPVTKKFIVVNGIIIEQP